MATKFGGKNPWPECNALLGSKFMHGSARVNHRSNSSELPCVCQNCELKISKFGGLWAKIWVKIEAVRLKFPIFLKRGSCERTLLLEMGPLRAAEEAWKGGLQGRTSPYLLSRSVPPGVFVWVQFQIPSSTSPTKPILSPTPFPMPSVSS